VRLAISLKPEQDESRAVGVTASIHRCTSEDETANPKILWHPSGAAACDVALSDNCKQYITCQCRKSYTMYACGK
jgi:hypothetical protein